MAKIIELIYTEERVGTGKTDDPFRMNPQLWTKSGKLVAEKDYHYKHEGFVPENMNNPFFNLSEEKHK